MNDNPICVIVADPQPAILAGVRAVLSERGIAVVGAHTALEALLEHTARAPEAIVIVDLNLGANREVELIERLLRQSPAARVIVFTARESTPTLSAAYAAGAKAVVSKRAALEVLVAAVERVAAGGVYFMAGVAETLALYHVRPQRGPDPREVLTARELAIYTALAAGRANEAIAAALGISTKSVANRAVQIRRKLGIRRGHEARVAREFGLIPDEEDEV